MEFEGKVILITGASSGIGADAARHLAKLGGKIALVARNVPRLNKVVEEIIAAGSPKPLMIVADVTKDAKRIMKETFDHFGQLDVLVNSAGISKPNLSVLNMRIEDFDEIMNVNIRSMIVLSLLALPHLEKTKGNIVNISSIGGRRAFPGKLPYCIAKAGVDQFTKCAALHFITKGIRVNAVNPGMIRTPIHLSSGVSTEVFEQKCIERAGMHPVGRIGTVEDTSNAIAFLASEKASFLNGILFIVDGGITVAQ